LAVSVRGVAALSRRGGGRRPCLRAVWPVIATTWCAPSGLTGSLCLP